ncbi:MAG: pyridoxamine 5'-phosphate oxidase [Sphingomicrobium sp.]
MADDPLAIFDSWFAQARASEPNDPDAVALATCGADGQPSVRMVLMKGHGPEGFTFYTNGESHKGDDIAANPKAAMLFHWKSLRRQVRIDGPIIEVSADEADAYFTSRGRDSRIGAWASDQSRTLPDRATFEDRFEDAKAKFDGQDVPRPPYWTGFRIRPATIEFWEDRPHRLHHRRLFTRAADGWTERLLYP